MTNASPYMTFSREKWASLRNKEPLTLTQKEIEALSGIDVELSIQDVEEIYLPLSRLLSYYVNATATRQSAMMSFLGEENKKVPFIISIAGSVSVGKSTTARVLQALLSRWKEHHTVSLITTDGFLYPNAYLEEQGLMFKKGFPQSYDIHRLLQFVMDIKSGKSEVKAPVYSHLTYDIIPNQFEVIKQPDILIVEGLNVLQSGMDYSRQKPRVFVSDFVNFSIYVDAEENHLEDWYVSRFLKFRKGAFSNPKSYFHSFAKLDEKEATMMAKATWREINRKNLRQNILPTRERASLILHKSENHAVDYVKLRR